MPTSQRPKAKASTRKRRSRARRAALTIDDVLQQVYQLLNWASKEPSVDAGKIIELAEAYRAIHLAAQQSTSSLTREAPRMLKEEARRAAKPKPEAPTLQDLIDRVVDNPEAWLSAPNRQFGGRQPRELIGTREEFKLVNLLRAVDQGLF